jgi:hypothetical protein
MGSHSRALDDILDGNTPVTSMAVDMSDNDPLSLDQGDSEQQDQAAEGMCVECGDQPASLFCLQCGDDFCDVCFQSLHRRGKRHAHTTKMLENPLMSALAANAATPAAVSVPANAESESHEGEGEEDSTASNNMNYGEKDKLNAKKGSMLDQCRWIPLRLDQRERKLLRLLEAALHVSEYTDRVDILTFRSKTQRIHAQLLEICAILSGLFVAADYKAGQKLIVDHEFADNAAFFQEIFEIGRRHKIMNPEKMRNEYGKLMHLLMDSSIPEVQDMLGFSLIKPVKTVFLALEECHGLSLLEDPDVIEATRGITADNRPRRQIQADIKAKESAQKRLVRKYQKVSCSEEVIMHCLYSIADNRAFLIYNRDPVDALLQKLHTHYDPSHITDKSLSLAIAAGQGGARLSHSHQRQYAYVDQSLSLWRHILNDFFRLWLLAEEDLLSANNFYRLRDTGQGLNRVQAAPRIGREMQRILATAMQSVTGDWVGSSVVHLGDTNVPNALMFMDKYTQISRILQPLVTVLEGIPKLCDDPALAAYLEQGYTSAERAQLTVLTDFLRHGFDGSGADNFFDAGSCIDGRLTSLWEQASRISKKPYYPLFLLCSFVGFDGEFR